MTLLMSEIKTPFGLLSVVVDDFDEKVIRSGFLPIKRLLTKELLAQRLRKDKQLFGILQVVNDWIDGDLAGLSKVATRQIGSDFAISCYKAMKQIKPAKTLSYQQLAAKSTSPKAVRAAASICAKNQNAPFVPCHRIITSRGEIGNYAYGSPLKIALLKHEGWKTQGKVPSR